MARHIDVDEPHPRDPPSAWARTPMSFSTICEFPTQVAAPGAGFFETLHRRRSGVGTGAQPDLTAALLWHATQLRERRFDGRFGYWESRTCPSAGGLHPISLLVVPVSGEGKSGIYINERHALGVLKGYSAHAISLNRASVAALANSDSGTTIQLVADTSILSACYENWTSLLWRDAGAMIATLGLIATALELTVVPLGREGTDIVRAFGLNAPFSGVGAVHIGALEGGSA